MDCIFYCLDVELKCTKHIEFLPETSSNICSLSDTDELDLNPVGGFLLAWPMDTKEMEKRENGRHWQFFWHTPEPVSYKGPDIHNIVLQEMLKCNKGERTAELEEALATVLDIIKSVNDSMHQIAITGFEVSNLIRQVIK